MKRANYRSYMILTAFFLIIYALPHQGIQKVRAIAVKTFAAISHESSNFSLGAKEEKAKQRQQSLETENYLLKRENETLRNFLLSREEVERQFALFQEVSGRTDGGGKAVFEGKALSLKESLEFQLCALPAKVIFREPMSWGSSIWIDIGERNNKALGRTVIKKNSPVVVGRALVGVVEYVGNKQSRVRLITDSALVPSVRVVRGGEKEWFLSAYVDLLITGLLNHDDCQEELIMLRSLYQKLDEKKESHYLIRGEVFGSSRSLWRSRSPLLRGVGFSIEGDEKQIDVMQEGDLLVTTGLDGVFPAGLFVGLVAKIEKQKKGSASYECEAKLAAGNLDNLQTVVVLPSLEFSK